jgi:uncharacterized protein with PIN domain
VIARGVQIGAGPLSSVAAGLADAAAAPGVVDPAVFLARLMDLRGSVELADRLVGRDPPCGSLSLAARSQLRALVAERVEAIRGDVLRTLGDPFQRRNALPTPDQVLAILLDTGALRSRQVDSLRAAAEGAWAPCANLLARVLAHVRAELGALREEVGLSIAALGPTSAHLERLDAALFGATAKARLELEDRLLYALARSVTSRFAAAVAELPDGTTTAHLRPWFESGGLLRADLERGRDAILGVLAHDSQRLAALLADR